MTNSLTGGNVRHEEGKAEMADPVPRSPFTDPFGALSRRRFLGLAGGAAAAGLLTACGLGNSSSSPTPNPGGASQSLAPVGGDLNLYVWQGYEEPDDSRRG